MNKKIVVSSMILVVGLLFVSVFAYGVNADASRKIVVFEDGVVNEAAKDRLIKKFGGVLLKNLNGINAKVVLIPEHAVLALSNQRGIARVDDDIIVHAFPKPEKPGGGGKDKGGSTDPLQSLPWGIDRIDAELAWASSTGMAVKVAVLDTGIDFGHNDLVVKGGFNAINTRKSAKDDNGHGTHVAGTIAALNNEIGVVGVGPSIDLYAIKALDRRGSGFLSDIIEGLDWAIANDMDVVNMSLGTSSHVQSFQDAILNAYNAGIILVAAAGNNGSYVEYPAAYPGVIAVSAIDDADSIASFSSRGPEVSLAAPGVGILSTYKDGSYAIASGTSMASPHVAGAAAVVLSMPIDLAYDANVNGIWDPSEVKQKLQDTSQDLGDVGFDELYGWGVVNVLNAIQ